MKFRSALVGLALGAATLSLGAPAHAGQVVTNGCVVSKAADHINICYTLFKPSDASASNKVPFIIHSHGWGGSRSTSGFADWTNNGFGVLSFDQRGWGQSGGQANVEDPELEGYDIETLVDFIGNLDWVQTDGPDDPVLGAIGGSYGGGYQTIGSLSEILHHGSTRFNALAPEITWFDLPDSLAPSGVARTVWNTALYAAGAAHVPNFIHEAFAYSVATGQFADGTAPAPVPNLKEIFYEHSPHWFADKNIKLDIPVLFGQGITDDLFVLNQGFHNYTDVLTDNAKANSYLIGYNGGHVLPEAFPATQLPNPAGDACSGTGGFGTLERKWYRHLFYGDAMPAELSTHFALATATGGGCIHSESLTNYNTVPVQPAGVIATTAGVGAPVAYKLADGPIRVAGIPRVNGTLTTGAVDTRAFFALSVGATPATAQVITNNLLPLHSLLPQVQAPFSMELPGVSIDVPAGQSLYLTVSPVSALFAGMNSRVPGAILLQDATVSIPQG